MNRLLSRVGAYALTSAFCLVTVGRLSAQTTPAPTANSAAAEETIELSPFVVTAEEDQGYQAKDTLAGTRVRTELKDIASSISVVTKQFMQDIGAKDSASLLQYTTNTEVGGLGGNFSGNAGGFQFNEDNTLLRPSQNTRVRGLDSADNTRDYFLTEIPWDGYIVDRVDLQRGPNSILFGVGSPAGIINTSINTASFKNKNIVENRVSDFGSLRNSVDLNKVLIKNELAIRVALLDDHTRFRQKPAFNHDKRAFGAIKYAPKFFGEGSNTSITANFEIGRINANRPRTLPPVDAVSPWFLTGKDKAGNLNLNKYTYNQTLVNPGAQPFDAANRGNYPYAWVSNGAVGRQFWADVVAYYGDNNDSKPTIVRQATPSGNFAVSPTGARAADGSFAISPGIDALFGARAVGIASYSSYMTASGIPGGSSYSDRSMSDPTIFDFYNNLIDGNNKFEWQKWKASNVAFSQTFFHDRVGMEARYDYQRYQDGQRVFIGNSDTYKIGIDIINTFYDGTPNPNVGRAYVANSDEQANHMTKIDRDSIRFTAYGDFRAEDVFDKSSRLAQWVGHHVFTGLVGQDNKRTFNRDWATSAASPNSWTALMGSDPSLTGHFRSFDYVSYISGSLASRSSASGANLSPVRNIVKAPKNLVVTAFDSHWNRPTNPTSPGYVDPAAPFIFASQNSSLPGATGSTANASTQSENPANYVGWKQVTVDFLNADAGDIDALTYNAGRQRNVIMSRAITWQGHMFNDSFIPVFGWRRDTISNNAAAGRQDTLGIVKTDFNLDPSLRKTQAGESRSWGGVYHVPAKWTKFIPGNTKVSAFYNRSENFKADNPRGDIFGNVIPNPIGKTKEYGVVISTLDDKLSIKATWYETKVANATLPGSNPLGQNSYYLWAVPVWGTAFAQAGDALIKGQSFNTQWGGEGYAQGGGATGQGAIDVPRFLPDGVTLNPAWLNSAGVQMQKAAINDWRNIPVGQQFFNAYGNEVALMNAAAIKAGDWANANPLWQQKLDYQPISGGQLAGFGGGPVFTVDTLSKGTEVELVAQPTKNWNVAVNVSKTFATRASLAPTIVNQINAMTSFLAGPAGDLRIWGGWGGPDSSFRKQWNDIIIKPYGVFKSQEGSNAPEISPWRFNAVTNYNFDHGRLKGSNVGAAVRWEQARVLGYEYNATIDNLDVSKPLKGESDSHLDLWFGHSRKLTSDINWRIQLNLRNVGEKKRLVPLSINPDGQVGYSRIAEGMAWQLTNTFEF